MSAPRLTDLPAERSGRGIGIWQQIRRSFLRRIWLPAAIYQALPWIYLANGAACLAGVIYLPDQAWLWPYIVLLGIACCHAAWLVLAARRRVRTRPQPAAQA